VGGVRVGILREFFVWLVMRREKVLLFDQIRLGTPPEGRRDGRIIFEACVLHCSSVRCRLWSKASLICIIKAVASCTCMILVQRSAPR